MCENTRKDGGATEIELNARARSADRTNGTVPRQGNAGGTLQKRFLQKSHKNPDPQNLPNVVAPLSAGNDCGAEELSHVSCHSLANRECAAHNMHPYSYFDTLGQNRIQARVQAQHGHPMQRHRTARRRWRQWPKCVKLK